MNVMFQKLSDFVGKRIGYVRKGSVAFRLQLQQAGMRQLQQDIFAAHLYESVKAQKTGSPMQNEYRRQISDMSAKEA